MGNPFKDDCPELLALDTLNFVDASVVDTMHCASRNWIMPVQEIRKRHH